MWLQIEPAKSVINVNGLKVDFKAMTYGTKGAPLLRACGAAPFKVRSLPLLVTEIKTYNPDKLNPLLLGTHDHPRWYDSLLRSLLTVKVLDGR